MIINYVEKSIYIYTYAKVGRDKDDLSDAVVLDDMSNLEAQRMRDIISVACNIGLHAH